MLERAQTLQQLGLGSTMANAEEPPQVPGLLSLPISAQDRAPWLSSPTMIEEIPTKSRVEAALFVTLLLDQVGL